MKKSTSFCEEDLGEDLIDRKESQATGAINFEIYKMFFKAVNSSCYVAIVMVMFIVAQIATSGADYFVSQWYVCTHSINSLSQHLDDSIR